MPNKEQEYRDRIEGDLSEYQYQVMRAIQRWDKTYNTKAMDNLLLEIERLSASHFATPQMEVDLGKVFDESWDVMRGNYIQGDDSKGKAISKDKFIETVQPLLSASTQIGNELSDEDLWRAAVDNPEPEDRVWGLAHIDRFMDGARWALNYRSELARRGEGKKEVG